MLGYAAGDQAILEPLDIASAGIPPFLRHAGDLPRRRPARATPPHLPPHPENPGDVVGKDHASVLRQPRHRGRDRPGIKGPPLPVMDGLHPIRDDDMRVELRI